MTEDKIIRTKEILTSVLDVLNDCANGSSYYEDDLLVVSRKLFSLAKKHTMLDKFITDYYLLSERDKAYIRDKLNLDCVVKDNKIMTLTVHDIEKTFLDSGFVLKEKRELKPKIYEYTYIKEYINVVWKSNEVHIFDITSYIPSLPICRMFNINTIDELINILNLCKFMMGVD